ncbi:hypothetical protein PVAND_001837 [Polypedilum vanderplanki]|uniref:Uncharacterized protein n=1 Tax=Polypedilum vanderplanki TaxID=319348 RepID=A0A9J6BQH5_POLVA|nr:hypothetical protein PVAND_001837 [Polypedilum vanderplanki]
MRQTHIAPPISRIIIFVIIFYALFVSSVFQGSIVKDLNAQTKITKINDVEDLFSADYKFVMNHMLHTVFKQQKGNELSKNLRKIAANAKTTIGNEEGLKILLKEKKYACLLDSLYVTTNYLNRYYDNKTGENLLEIVPEKAFEFYVAVMASRDSPFILSLNQNILRWVEGGFDYYHIHKATHDNYINIFYEKHKKGLTSHSKFKSLSIDDLKSVFILYGYMIAVCIIIALLEISYFYISTMNKQKESMNFVI